MIWVVEVKFEISCMIERDLPDSVVELGFFEIIIFGWNC